MSVCLILLPIVLAMHACLDKKNFESFVDSLQIKIPTYFKDEEEFINVIRDAGYDINKCGGLYKTNLVENQKFFFWEKIQGIWTAVFTKAITKENIISTLKNIEFKAGKKIFKYIDEEKFISTQNKSFPTNFRDVKLLKKTLEEYDIKYNEIDENKIICENNGMTMIFNREYLQPYNLEITNITDINTVYSCMIDLNDAYNHLSQVLTYEKMKLKIKEKGITIDDESVNEDNSIIITLNISQ